MKRLLIRTMRGVVLLFGLLLLLYAVARPTQKYIESLPQGERGVYLQMLDHDGVTLRWRTEEAERGVVSYSERGKAGALHEVVEGDERQEHEVQLTGLSAKTYYRYTVGNVQGDRHYGGEAYWFHTAPQPGAVQPVRLWVQGDPGYYSELAQAVRDSAFAWMKRHPRENLPLLDLWLTTGDNAYKSGNAQQFHDHLFEPYADLLRNYPYWPAYGNHDARRWVFFDLFRFPVDGEMGGVPSGSPHYFSFDYANTHIVFLDTEEEGLAGDDEMAQWLRADLSATRREWIIVLFHHPPYTKGSHDSDDTYDSLGRMGRVRENIVPILEDAGVDLVISGHSHVYERSYLIDCHYAAADSFNATMRIGESTDHFLKPKGRVAHQGTIYMVVGASSKPGNGPLDHPAMAVAIADPGSLVIDIHGDHLAARYINSRGEVRDEITLKKSSAVPLRPGRCIGKDNGDDLAGR